MFSSFAARLAAPRECSAVTRIVAVELELLRDPTARIAEPVLEAIAVYAAKATWPAGFTVYQRGASADGVFIVLRGRIVLRSRVKAGRGFVPAVAAAGETFGAEGLAPHGRYATEARADEETETLHLSGPRMRAFLREQPQHAIALVGQVMAQHATLLEKLRELATLSVEQRLVAALARMAQHAGFVDHDGRITLDAGRYRLLCEMVGATRESVSLVLNRLVGEGLAERQGTSFVVAPAAALLDRVSPAWREAEIGLLVGSDSFIKPAEA